MSANLRETLLSSLVDEYGGERADWTEMRSLTRVVNAVENTLAERDARLLREVADQADSIGHHWSGAPALAFFALAGDLRARAALADRGAS